MKLALPPTLSAYVQATNARDYEAFTALFTPDAVVADESRTYTGREEIRAWRERTATEYGFTLEPLELGGKDEEPELACRVSGTFDGSPITLRFLFTLEGDQIRRLTIHD